MKKAVLFAFAACLFTSAAAAERPSDAWFFCKSLLNPQICKIFR